MSQFDRQNPFLSRMTGRSLLNQKGSTKQTYHLCLSLDNSSIVYEPGDCAAILPSNAIDEVEPLIHLLHLTREKNGELCEFLTNKANLQKPHPALIRKILGKLSDAHIHCMPADLLALNRTIAIPPEEIPHLFLPLLPRYYSIASSQLSFPQEMHLLVALVHTHLNGKEHKGVASRFLCEDAFIEKTPIPLYIRKSHNFILPDDPTTSIIMVGSGTGLAPYRAFMQHRLATNAQGRNWLFLGERHRKSDFYYEDFWERLQAEKQLRLSLAFSRDSDQKLYVQHRMWEERRDLWAWIQDGAYLYVCGDAHRMAKDVETTLHRIAMSEGNLSEDDAHHFIKNLRTQKCYRMDVY